MVKKYAGGSNKGMCKILIPSGWEDKSRGADYVKATFNKYGVKSYAILVDHTTVPEDWPDLPDYKFCGFYSFGIDMVDKKIAGREVKLITTNGPVPACDGWLIMSTSRAATFALNRVLMLTGNENQIIVRLYGGQVTEIAAYMDMFSGETETLMYINHYFNRKYETVFPLDLRYTIRECDGTIRKAGQRIIAPGALTVIDSRQMKLGEFTGYLWLELEVENLQTRVQPFIHFWADYINATGICRNHQSGFLPWPANTVFIRAFMPIDPDMEVTVSFYNDNNCAVQPRVLLHYNQNGQEKALERRVEPIRPKHMSYQNISRVFNDVSFDGVNSAYFLLTCDQPLHRPNQYLHPKGTKQFINLNHQTGGRVYCHWGRSLKYTGAVVEIFKRFNIHPCMMSLPLLDESLQIETYLGLLLSTICTINEFTFIIRNESGETVFSKDERLDGRSPQFINLNEYARRHGVHVKSGTFNVVPREGLVELPINFSHLLGFKHKDYKYICFHPNSSIDHTNMPFYIRNRFSKKIRYKDSPLEITDRFAPGMISEEFDSLYIVANWSLFKNYSITCEYDLEIIDAAGKSCILHRKIPPQSQDVFWLSDALKEAGIACKCPAPAYYTLWTKSYDTLLIGFHFLYRKRDHALTVADTFNGVSLKPLPQISGIEITSGAVIAGIQALRKIKKFIPRPLKKYLQRKIVK